MGSNKSTILNYIREFKFKEIESVIFTSFNFNKEFFDNNILPAVLKVPSTKNIKALRHLTNIELTKIPVAVFYDANQSITDSASYRYQIKAIKLDNGFFHTKNIIICGKDKEDKSLAICTVSSANLTKSAYASNIEVFSHIEIKGKGRNSNSLLEFLQKLQDLSNNFDTKNITALEKGINFIENFKMVEDSKHSLKFIIGKQSKPFGILNGLINNHENKEATLISPYWSEEMIGKLPVNENTTVILPRSEGKFTITKDGIKKFIDEKKYKVYYPKLLDAGNKERFLHAKCYFVKDGSSLSCAIGSSNFTSAGLGISGLNIESMLFMNEKMTEGFTIFQPNEIDEIVDISKISDEKIDSEIKLFIPFSIEVILDWKDKVYKILIDKPEKITSIKLPGIDEIVKLDADMTKSFELDKLTNSNTYLVKYMNDGEENFYYGLILEINLNESKREYFYKFSYSEILDSWIKKKDITNFQTDEIDDSEEFNDYDAHIKTKTEYETDILDNYYEIYKAFYNLRNELENKKDEKEFLILTGPTSLLKLFESIKNNDTKDNKVDEVLNFLILLEIQDILEKNEYPLFDNLAEEIQKIEKHIIYGNLTRDRLDWFKTKLFLK